jgi:hypothetical protein
MRLVAAVFAEGGDRYRSCGVIPSGEDDAVASPITRRKMTPLLVGR